MSMCFAGLQIKEFGVTKVWDLKANVRKLLVTEEMKEEYVKLVCQMKMTVPFRNSSNLFSMDSAVSFQNISFQFSTNRYSELLISGLPTIDIDDLEVNTEYQVYNATSLLVCVSLVIN
jgi:E3 ubiquitin-protein ligase HUWE1